MKYILEKDRLKIYDDKGNLIEERNVSFEDLKNIILNELANNYYIEFIFTIAGQSVTVKAQLKKVSQ